MIDIPGYKIVRRLGEGRIASAYLAVQESFEREVLLKVMHGRLAEDPAFTARFLHQARVVSGLDHPNVLTIYDAGVQGNQHYLSMEYLPGSVLSEVMQTLTPPQSLQLIRGLALALEYAHQRGHAHHNVKPDNILVREDDGRAVLMDFGLGALGKNNPFAPEAGAHYQAPEQIGGNPGDSRSDIYSLGLVLFELLTGRLPEKSDFIAHTPLDHRRHEFPRLPGNLLLLQPIISRSLAKKSKQRYQTAGELVAAIDAVTDEDIEAIQLATRHYTARLNSAAVAPPRNAVAAAATRLVGRLGFKPAQSSDSQRELAAAGADIERRDVLERVGPAADSDRISRPYQSDQQQMPQSEDSSAEPLSTVLDGDESEGAAGIERSEWARRWPWATAAALVVAVAATGAGYSGNHLPPPMAALANELAEKSHELGDDISAAIVAGSLAAWTKLTPLGNLFTGKDAESTEPSLSGVQRIASDPQPFTADKSSDGSATPSRSTAREDDKLVKEAFGSDRALQLRAQLERDISVSPRLAEDYRQSLAAAPDKQEAEWGLRVLLEHHYRSIAKALDARETERAKSYFASLRSSFPPGTGVIELKNEAEYQALRERFEQLRVAQSYLAQAERYLAVDALTESAATAAVKAFQRAMEVDPGNPHAANGLTEMVERYRAMAEKSLAEGRLEQAVEAANRGLGIDDDHDVLQKLSAEAREGLDRQAGLERLSLMARQQMEAGNYLSPRGESAYHYYKKLLDLDPNNAQAVQGLSRIEARIIGEAETHIKRNESDQARSLLAAARDMLGSSERLAALESALEKNQEADAPAAQPSIRQLLVSSQGPDSMTGIQKETLNVEQTIYVAFNYQNFKPRTSVVQAMLYDSSRGEKIAQVPIIVNGAGGVKYFQIDRPVKGFAEGSYDIDLLLGDERLTSLSFKVNR